MSASSTRMVLADAEARAAVFVDRIESFCEQIVVAGSIRRRRPDVGDIEIVAEPTMDDTTDLFGNVVGAFDALDHFLADLLAHGEVAKRETNGKTAWGPKHKRILWRETPIDLFCAERARFGLILAIRTGPYTFSHQFVTPKGMKTNDGRPGLLPTHLRVSGGWLTYRVSGQRIETPTEEAFFAAIGLPFVAPEDRR